MRAVLLPERGDNRRAITWGNNKWLNQTMPNVINPVYNGLCNPTNSQFNQTSATSSHITTHQHGVQLSLLPYQPSSYSRSIRGASRRVYKVHILLNFAPPCAIQTWVRRTTRSLSFKRCRLVPYVARCLFLTVVPISS